MRWLIRPIVWFSILIFFVLLVVLTGLSFSEFVQLKDKNDNQIIGEFEFVTDANYYRSLPVTWLIIGIILLILLLIFILIFLVLFKRLRIALAILKEASKAVSYNLISLFWPIIPFLLQLCVLIYWGCLVLFLITSGKPIYRRIVNTTLDDNMTFEITEEFCYPNASNPIDDCYFSQYGYNPQIDLDQILNGITLTSLLSSH